VGEDRALNRRRDKDEVKDFSVTLVDVDTAIFNYLDTVINPTVVDAGRAVKVPLNYASPERWKAIKKDGYMRDKQGKVQCPAIAFRRTAMQRNDNLTTLNRYLQYPAVRKFSEKNQYDKFSLMTGFKPVQEAYSVAMPDHIIVNYDFIVWTEYVEQSNKIIESINFATEDYWGDMKRFRFRTSISDFNFQTEVSAEQDRIVRTTFGMMTYAYLLPDRYENYKNVVQKAFTQRKLVVTGETTRHHLRVKEDQHVVADVTKLNGNVVPLIDPLNIKGGGRERSLGLGLSGLQSSFAVFSGVTASYALYSGTSSYAVSASFAFNQSVFDTGSFVVTASGALNNLTASYAMTSSYCSGVTADGGSF
jgi:hypothetical protein